MGLGGADLGPDGGRGAGVGGEKTGEIPALPDLAFRTQTFKPLNRRSVRLWGWVLGGGSSAGPKLWFLRAHWETLGF